MEKNADRSAYEEKELHPANGWAVLFITLFVMLGALAMIIWGASESTYDAAAPMLIIGLVVLAIGWFPFVGLRVIRPNEALVLTLFGKYVGTLKKRASSLSTRSARRSAAASSR